MTAPPQAPGAFQSLAERKLNKVLGEGRGGAVLARVLREVGLSSIDDAEGLARVGEALRARGGIEAAVGAMLKVDASIARLRAIA